MDQAAVAQFRDAFAVYGSLRRGRNRIEYSTQPVDEISIEEVTEALDAVAAMGYYNSFYTSGYSTTARKQLMVHEMGHELGLDHAGTSTCSGQPIMYPNSSRYFTCNHQNPQPDDIDGSNSLY